MIDTTKVNKAIEQSQFIESWHTDESEANIKSEFGEQVWQEAYLVFTNAINNHNWGELDADACKLTFQYLTERYPYLTDLAKNKVIELGTRFWHPNEG